MIALREKHLAYVADNLSYFNDCKTSFAISECKSWINKIFDDVEAELESLQSRSCEWCKHFRDDNHAPSFDGYCVDVGTYIEGENELLPLDVDRGFCCNRYEAKEQL